MKWIFKLFVFLHVSIYRLSKGSIWGSMGGMNVLLLTTKGRKSGQERTVSLTYMNNDKNSYVIIASNGGQTTHPGWYFNLQANSEVTIQVKDRLIKVKASTADTETRKQLWAKLLQTAPNYGNYEKTANREIPVVILQPV